MPAERYYIDRSPSLHEQVELADAEFHHLARVMRARVNDPVELVNGKGMLAEATVSEILKDRVRLHIDAISQENRTGPTVILAQAIPKPNRLDFVLEKGTELGVDEFWLFPGMTSVKKDFSPNQLERAGSLLLAAMKQCGRLFLPSITLKPRLKDWLKIPSPAYFGDTDRHAPLFSPLANNKPLPESILFFVGPESGFTEEEVAFLKTHDAEGVKLHQNILRTDTASLLAVGLIAHRLQG